MGTLKRKMVINIIIVAFLAIGIAFIFYLIFSTDGITLVAQNAVPVFATEKQAMTWPHPVPIAELSSGQTVPVTKCVDVKSYMIYKIRLPDGRDGFVLDGQYLVMRNGKRTSC